MPASTASILKEHVMNFAMPFRFRASILGLCLGALLPQGVLFAETPSKRSEKSVIANLQPYLDASGFVATYSASGKIDQGGAFFQSLGSNGRSCATCHVASQAMSFTPRGAQVRFAQTRGRDPLFAAIDGANCPTARPGDPFARSLLLTSGLIRISLPVPATSSQFTVQAAYDPYRCAVDSSAGNQVISFYRRPLPSSNLHALSAVMFDGRESVTNPLNNSSSLAANLNADLTQQAIDAVTGHAQGSVPTAAQVNDIVTFELGLSTAQIYDFRAGFLGDAAAVGGPMKLVEQTSVYYPGINDSLTPEIFSPEIFSLYGSWLNLGGNRQDDARAQIAAGEVLFNSFPINITAVRGINDNAALGKPAVLTGTCGTCHDTPNVGDHSLPLPLDIGTGHSAQYESDPQIKAALQQLSFPKLPVYRVDGCIDPFNGQATLYTTDLGKAMLTGQCGDLNRIKGPILRGLPARAPYFHNGAAANLSELVNFYNKRFDMGLTDQQKAQLVAFLNTL
jgi:cytochrome c peroxidase